MDVDVKVEVDVLKTGTVETVLEAAAEAETAVTKVASTTVTEAEVRRCTYRSYTGNPDIGLCTLYKHTACCRLHQSRIHLRRRDPWLIGHCDGPCRAMRVCSGARTSTGTGTVFICRVFPRCPVLPGPARLGPRVSLTRFRDVWRVLLVSVSRTHVCTWYVVHLVSRSRGRSVV